MVAALTADDVLTLPSGEFPSSKLSLVAMCSLPVGQWGLGSGCKKW